MYVLPVLVIFLPTCHVQAWSTAMWSTASRRQHMRALQQREVCMSSSSSMETSSTRGEWLRKTAGAGAVAAIGLSSSLLANPTRSMAAVVAVDAPSVWAPEGNPTAAASWFPLLKKCYKALEDVLENWDKLAARQDGDAIRRLIGTIGVSSPLSSLRKAFVSVRDAEEESQGDIEVIEFVEAYMEVLTALGDAENDLYSANFAEYAGGGGMKASQFISKARKSLIVARDHFKEVNRILGI